MIRPDETPSKTEPREAAPIAGTRGADPDGSVPPASDTAQPIDETAVPPLTDEEDTMGG
jgi:hypothetical protein